MSTLRTKLNSYKTLQTKNVTSVDDDISDFSGIPDGSVDLLEAGSVTDSNAISLILYATGDAAATVTQKIYGICDQGPPQLIASVVWTLGTATRATGVRWAGSVAITDTHMTTVGTADSGNNRVASVNFDTTGFRYIKSVFTAKSGTVTTTTCLYRGY